MTALRDRMPQTAALVDALRAELGQDMGGMRLVAAAEAGHLVGDASRLWQTGGISGESLQAMLADIRERHARPAQAAKTQWSTKKPPAG